ncbi:hypothetical protein G3570_10445 [Balneolaceae bacterium YR4-1]|uniref:Lipoprotein n=1 Tax=Halalkalibaculum roseum TaxID=2709311 RepID=A0A6M1T9Y7_9BACT|nr:hypothetical protein [Halalkalibaculum roseum]NGP77053.1 hypothetical protein [Halalkalibaculum roseum]
MLSTVQKFTLLIVIGAVLVTSCNDDPASLSNEQPPEIPPVESMSMDFSNFDGYQQNKEALSKEVNTNFAEAAIRAFVIKSVVDLNLAIPKALLAAASESEAEFNEEGEWVWNYTKNAGNQTYEVRLVASQQNENEINWQFFVTNSALNISDKLFFEGTTTAGGTQGTWTYYSLMSSSEEAVSVTNWSVSEEGNVDLRLEVVSDRYNNEGDFIEYSFDGTVKNVVFYNANEDSTTELQWNIETNVGYIIAPNYNNGEKACWNENFENVTCG